MARGLAVSVNGRHLVTVSTEGYNILGVRIAGDRISEEFASLDVSAGLYGEGESGQHLTWVNLAPLRKGDEVTVEFLDDAKTSHKGKTLEELFPEEERPMGPWEPLDDMFTALAKRPKTRERFTFIVASSGAEPIHAATRPDDHSFGFSVSWAWTSPEVARVSLSSASLAEIASRSGGADHASLKLRTGQRVKFCVQ